MKVNKWLSRKFLVAIGAMIVTIVVGLGYQLDPKLIAMLTAAESFLWILIEGITDICQFKQGKPSQNRFASRKFLLAIVSMVTLIAFGLGKELDAELIAALTGSQGALWMIIEGILDSMGIKPTGKE